jgi:hypothetical protein
MIHNFLLWVSICCLIARDNCIFTLYTQAHKEAWEHPITGFTLYIYTLCTQPLYGFIFFNEKLRVPYHLLGSLMVFCWSLLS